MRIAIVENGRNLALELRAFLQKLDGHSVALSPGGEQFLFAWEEQPYDPVFLDARMKSMSGLKIVRKVREEDAHAHPVFLINDPSFVSEGYEVNAVRYWLKPAQEEKLCQFLGQLEAPKVYLLWSVDGELCKLYEEDIYYSGSDAHYVHCHYHRGISRIRGNSQRERTESSGDFLNCHCSHYVNLNHIHAPCKDGYVLDNWERISVSRGMKRRVQEEIMKHCEQDLLCRF